MFHSNAFKSALSILGIASLTILITQCGGSSATTSGSGDDSSVAITSVSSLPAATNPVVDATSSSLSFSTMLDFAAETGLPFGTTTSSDFSSSSSMAACEMFNQTKQLMNEAGMGDLLGCYVKTSAEAYVISEFNTNNIDLYDGEYHVFALDFTGSEFDQGEDAGGPSKIKTRVIRDINGNVTSFEMFSCERRNETNVQSEYVRQDIDNGEFSLQLIGNYFQETDYGDYSVTATSALNEDGEFVGEKTIVMQSVNTWNEVDSNTSKITGIQTSSQMTVYGFQSGEWSDSESDMSGTYSNQIYGINELLDTNVAGEDYNIKLLALGDGAVKGLFAGSDGENSWSDTVTESFSGDTTLSTTYSESEFADEVTAATLPEIEEVSISFSESQSWDCSDEPEGTINFANLGVDLSSCENYQLGHQWFNCYQLIDNDPGEGEGEE